MGEPSLGSASVEINEGSDSSRRVRFFIVPARRLDTNPKLLKILHPLEEEVQTHLESKEKAHNIFKTFGPKKTRSEKAIVEALEKTGKFGCRLFMLYIFVLWYMVAVYAQNISIKSRSSIIVRCKIPELEECFTFMEVLNVSVANKTPSFRDEATTQYCSYNVHDYKKARSRIGCNYNKLQNYFARGTSKTKSCKEFVIQKELTPAQFVKDPARSISLREEYNLFCTSNVWDNLVNTMASMGCVLSCLTLGLTSDIYGRKRIFIITSLIHLAGCLIIFIPSVWFLLIGRFLIGAGDLASLTLYIIFLETCADHVRIWLGLLLVLAAPLTNLTRFALHYKISYWKMIHLANTCMLVVLPVGIWFMPESPRWLMIIGNKSEARKIFEHYHGTIGTRTTSSGTITQAEHRPTLKENIKVMAKPLFRERVLAILITYLMSSISLHEQETTIIKDFHAVVEEFYLFLFTIQVFISPIMHVLSSKCGRRRTIFGFFCILIVIDGIIFMANRVLKNTLLFSPLFYCHLALAGCLYIVMQFYSVEIFPTPFRATILSLCLLAFCLGSFTHKFFYTYLNLGSDNVKYMPGFMASTACALMLCFLPNLRKNELPDTATEAIFSSSYE